MGKQIGQAILATAAICLLAFLGLYHQPYQPISWQDEGFVLQGAMNLVRYGKYAMLSSEGFRILDQPLVANGPGVVLPIAASFSLFGIGLLQARLVVWLFMLWAIVMFYLVAVRLSGKAAACISTITLVSATTEGFLYYGRIALGNMPALAYLLTGSFFLIEWIRSRQSRYTFLAGLFFGLAVITKAQTALILPTLVSAALIERIYFRKTGVGGYITMIAVILGFFLFWYIVQYLIVGRENFTQHLAAIQSSSRVSIFVLNPERIPRNAWQLMISGIPVYLFPGVLWAIWSLREKPRESVIHFTFLLLTVIWLSWYVIFSIGWHRYFFEPAVIGMLFSGQLIVYLASSFKKAKNATTRVIATAMIGVLAVAVGIGLVNNLRRIIAEPDTTLQEFSNYLSQNVPPGAVIESWEWQIDPLVNLTFHHPTNDWVDKMTLALTFGKTPQEIYDFRKYNPSFLITGPFARSTGFYDEAVENDCCDLILEDDPYFLYQIISPE